MVVVCWFAEIAEDPILQSPLPDDLIRVGRHQNCRDLVPRILQVLVEFSPVIPGMLTATRQATSTTKGDARKLATVGNASTC
jgi:hypothetical protein